MNLENSFSNKKTILLKITGEAIPFINGIPDLSSISKIAEQIKSLINDYFFGIVIGGGNIARGKNLAISELNKTTCHYIGMISTYINGLIMQNIFNKFNINTKILTALEFPEIGTSISIENINQAKKNNDCVIFCGGTGNPYFTTDTAAILRSLELGSDEVWKATKVSGVYEQDPMLYPNAKLLNKLNYNKALELKLGIMDGTALLLAQENKVKIRVFNIFDNNSIIKVANDINYGSTIE